MNIEFQSRNYELHDDIRDYADKKLRKVTKFLEEPIEIRVTLQETKHGKIADLHVAHRHDVLQADAENDEMRDAVNLAVDKVEKQARRARKKFQARRRRADRKNGSHTWPLEVLDRGSVGESEGPRIVETSELTIKPMSLEEAALGLEASEHQFLVFRNAQNDRISVLYKRSDRNYGLISPQL